MLARSEVYEVGSAVAAQSSDPFAFSVAYDPPKSGQLPVFALIRFAPSESCGGGDATGAQPIGLVNVQ